MQIEAIDDPEYEFNERLRMELGWGEVAKGLNQVLFGYLVLFLGTAVGFGLVTIAMYSLGDDVVKKGAKPSNTTFWQLYLGLGILSVIGLISYCIIIGGQFRCMLHASERHGARWFMFLCIACLFLGPALELASGISNWQAIQELKKNPGRVQDFHLNPMGQWLQLVGFAIGMLYPLCFVLFLRAVAVCLRASSHRILINVFLVIKAFLVAATGFVLFRHRPGGPPITPYETLALGAAWGVMLLLYVGSIVITRICIFTVMGNVKSPLAVGAEQ